MFYLLFVSRICESINYFNKCLINSHYIPECTPFQSDIFSLGMTILHCIFLEPLNYVYDYPKGEFLEKQFKSALKESKKYVSKGFYSILKSCLNVKADKRMDPIDLEKLLSRSGGYNNNSFTAHNISENVVANIPTEERERRRKIFESRNNQCNVYLKKDEINYKDVENVLDIYEVPKFKNRDSYSDHRLKSSYNPNLSLIERADKLISTLKSRSPAKYTIPQHNDSFYNKPRIQTQIQTQKFEYRDYSPIKTSFNREASRDETYKFSEKDSRKIGTIKTTQDRDNSKSMKSTYTEVEKYDSPDFKKEYQFDGYLNSPPSYIKALRHSSSPRKRSYKKDSSNNFDSDIFLGEQSKIISHKYPAYEKIPYKEFIKESYGNGCKYEGEKVGEFRHGKGKFYYGDGGYYDGNWRENKMSGYGVLYYASGKPAYKGEWFDNKFNGKGILFNEQSTPTSSPLDYTDLDLLGYFWEYYEGEFQDDSKHGFGVIMMSNGEKFEGEFDDDTANGRGVYHTIENKKINGEWKSNRLMHSF